LTSSSKKFGVRLVTLAAGLAALIGVAMPLVAGGAGSNAKACGATVKVAEHVKYVINQYVQDGMRFAPGTVTVKSGCKLTIEFAAAGQSESHSLSLVKQSDLPRTAAQMENCKICKQIASKHLKYPGQPPGPNNPIAHWIVNVGKRGFDVPGDSIVIAEAKDAPAGHKRVTMTVSARAGTTLYFMCGLHPWMQGKIHVT
jgi:plastocyanin